ncbi:MAG: hypothetical protein GKR95_06955 [Gammaproteobacteria bacterium]|nr:hypothetical protein [Gammaproteobacteria bacterium]
MEHLIPYFPDEAPQSVYTSAAEGKRTIPLDAVGVDQAAVMAVSALINLVAGREDKVVFVPRVMQVDTSNLQIGCKVMDAGCRFSARLGCRELPRPTQTPLMASVNNGHIKKERRTNYWFGEISIGV